MGNEILMPISFDVFIVVISTTVMALGFSRACRLWRERGKGEVSKIEGESNKSFWKTIVYLVSHRKILENRGRGVAHLLIFWGFLIPLGAAFLAQFKPVLPSSISNTLSLLLDVLGLSALGGIGLLIYKRYHGEKGTGANLHLWLLLAIVVTGFLTEGERLSIVERSESFLWWISPVGSVLSLILPRSPRAFELFLRSHFMLLLLFMAYLPFSRMRHVVTATWNVYLKEKNQGIGVLRPLALKSGPFGTGEIEDFTWQELLEVDACVECGRCDEGCPALLSGKPLSPRQVVKSIREKMYDVPLRDSPKRILREDDTLNGENIWDCTNCRACVERCPVLIEPLGKIMGIRRFSVLDESRFPAEYKTIFRNLEIFGDPLGKGTVWREEWAQDYNLAKVRIDRSTTIFWAGCMGSLYNDRTREVTGKAATLLERAGVEFGILGKKESCCGDTARRMGNEYLFQRLARENIRTFKERGVRKLITSCPHCYHVFKNEYPALGSDMEVFHLAEIIKELLAKGSLRIAARLDGDYTFHDPCYLGRYNRNFKDPRDILGAVLTSGIKEMRRSGINSLCCGAGGGNLWRGRVTGRRIEELRVHEAAETGASGIISCCPHCDVMFAGAVRQAGLENSLNVIDLAEVVERATDVGE
jgi:Fe-S oxidoreductase/nitrate reductase gamma subunit